MNFYAHFPFFMIYLKLNTGYFQIILIRNFDFCENIYSGINSLPKGIMNLYCPHVLSHVGEILYYTSSRDAIEHLLVSWKWAQGRSYLSYGRYWKCIDGCTLKHDILNVNNALVKCVYCVEGYTIVISVKNEFGRKILSTISEILYNQNFRGPSPIRPHSYDRLTSALIIMWRE
jgi:hypothetical protein